MEVGAAGSIATQGFGVSANEPEDLKMEFLNLLLTQMRNQDPLNPSDSTQMMQQLAVFSQLEQLQAINSNLNELQIYQQSFSNTQMMNLVGKRVTVLGNRVTMEDGDPSRILVRSLGRGTAMAQIRNEQGVVVRTIENAPLKGGFSELKWDGRDDEGNPLPDGDYTVSVSALGPDGNFQQAAVFESGIVDSIQFDNGQNFIMVNGRLFTPNEIVEVGVGKPETIIVNGGYPGRPPLPGEDGDDGSEDEPTYFPFY